MGSTYSTKPECASTQREIQAFWGFPEDPAHPDLVPPLLVYADLMATQDGRNLETARLLYEQFLEPTHRP